MVRAGLPSRPGPSRCIPRRGEDRTQITGDRLQEADRDLRKPCARELFDGQGLRRVALGGRVSMGEMYPTASSGSTRSASSTPLDGGGEPVSSWMRLKGASKRRRSRRILEFPHGWGTPWSCIEKLPLRPPRLLPLPRQSRPDCCRTAPSARFGIPTEEEATRRRCWPDRSTRWMRSRDLPREDDVGIAPFDGLDGLADRLRRGGVRADKVMVDALGVTKDGEVDRCPRWGARFRRKKGCGS